MTAPDIASLRALYEAATPGPWRWEINRKNKSVEICGGHPKQGFGRYDLTVMSFARWGMNSAAPRFWNWSNGNWSTPPKRADELAVAVPGREHHANWFADIDHPDAQIIVAAVSALPALLAAAEKLARYEAAMGSDEAREAVADVFFCNRGNENSRRVATAALAALALIVEVGE